MKIKSHDILFSFPFAFSLIAFESFFKESKKIFFVMNVFIEIDLSFPDKFKGCTNDFGPRYASTFTISEWDIQEWRGMLDNYA